MKQQPYPLFEVFCDAHGIPRPQREVRFAPPRRWRFDFAWPDHGKIAVEIEGGAFKGPGHRSVGVFLRNLEKYNEAAILGWTLLRVTTDDVQSGAVFTLLKRALRPGGDVGDKRLLEDFREQSKLLKKQSELIDMATLTIRELRERKDTAK